MARILFLAHRAPFPPDKGDKIRAFHFLEGLAKRHEVWLGAGVDDLADLQHLPQARALCRDVYFAPLHPLRRATNMAAAALTGAPLSVARFRHPGLGRWVERTLREASPDIVFVYSSALSHYVVGRMAPGVRLIVDFVDADAEKWRSYSHTASWPMRQVYVAESRRVIRFEAEALAAAETGVLISQTERDLLARFLPRDAGKLRVIPNGVDVDYFQPGATAAAAGGESLIVFCGRMDYLPNIEGARWFAREVLPKVRARCGDAVFRIVGAAPTAPVLDLAALPGVEVTGSTPDVRPHLLRAAVVVTPLQIARGIQNKLLEGLACGRPVVTTPQALDGVAAEPGREVLVAEGAGAFADAVVRVLQGQAPADLGARGREFVLRRHRWAAQIEALDRLIKGADVRRSGQAAA